MIWMHAKCPTVNNECYWSQWSMISLSVGWCKMFRNFRWNIIQGHNVNQSHSAKISYNWSFTNMRWNICPRTSKRLTILWFHVRMSGVPQSVLFCGFILSPLSILTSYICNIFFVSRWELKAMNASSNISSPTETQQG